MVAAAESEAILRRWMQSADEYDWEVTVQCASSAEASLPSSWNMWPLTRPWPAGPAQQEAGCRVQQRCPV